MTSHSSAAFIARHQFVGEVTPTPVTLAYRLADLLRVCVLAEGNDTSGLYGQNGKGLGNTLQLAEKWTEELIEEIERLEMREAQNAGKSDVTDLLVEWRTQRAKAIALGRISDEDTSDYLALCKEWEQTGKAIANPSSSSDAAAMLQWCIEDADGGKDDAEYRKAHQTVIAYLGGVEAPGA